MIELAFGAALLAASAIVVRVVQTRRRNRSTAAEDTPDTPRSGAPATRKPPPGPRGLCSGDVLLYADSELWLAGTIAIEEPGTTLRLFPTPGGTRASWVAQLDREGREIALLEPSDEVPAGRVPESLPIRGLRLSLRRRGEGGVHIDGEHLPPTTEHAAYTILGAAGGRLLVVIDFKGGERLALTGERLDRSMFDLLPGGDPAR